MSRGPRSWSVELTPWDPATQVGSELGRGTPGEGGRLWPGSQRPSPQSPELRPGSGGPEEGALWPAAFGVLASVFGAPVPPSPHPSGFWLVTHIQLVGTGATSPQCPGPCPPPRHSSCTPINKRHGDAPVQGTGGHVEAGPLVSGRLRCDPRDPGPTQQPLASADRPPEPTPLCRSAPAGAVGRARGPKGKHVHLLWPSVRVTLVDQLGRGVLHPIKPVPLRPGAAGGPRSHPSLRQGQGSADHTQRLGRKTAGSCAQRSSEGHSPGAGDGGAWKPSSPQAGRGRHLPWGPAQGLAPGPCPSGRRHAGVSTPIRRPSERSAALGDHPARSCSPRSQAQPAELAALET